VVLHETLSTKAPTTDLSGSLSWADRNQIHVVPLIDKSKWHRKGPGTVEKANPKSKVSNDKKQCIFQHNHIVKAIRWGTTQKAFEGNVKNGPFFVVGCRGSLAWKTLACK
jgi:hypothetical protein